VASPVGQTLRPHVLALPFRQTLRCAALSWFVAAFAPACASGRAAQPPAENGWGDTLRAMASAVAPARPVEHWDLAAQLRELRPATRRDRSEHLGGDLEGEVLAGKKSGYPLRGPASIAVPGTTLVERLFAPGGSAPVTYLVMVKHDPGFDPSGGDWEYLVIDPEGGIRDRGKLALCMRCHAEAPHDHLFGGERQGAPRL
jgi:hypothetical protein